MEVKPGATVRHRPTGKQYEVKRVYGSVVSVYGERRVIDKLINLEHDVYVLSAANLEVVGHE